MDQHMIYRGFRHCLPGNLPAGPIPVYARGGPRFPAGPRGAGRGKGGIGRDSKTNSES